MKITEKDRLDLRQELERVFANKRFAEIAMEAMPPIDYDNLATKDDVSALGLANKQDLNEIRSELKVDVADLRNELKGEMADLRNELKGEMADLRSEFGELKVEIVTMNADLQMKMASQLRLTFLMQLVMFGALVSYLSATL